MRCSFLLSLLCLLPAVSVSPLHAAAAVPPPLPSLVLPIHSFGLANRLRLLASGVSLSKLLGLPLYVDWRPSFGCNASLPDLFDLTSSAFDSSFKLYPSSSSDALRSLLLVHEEARIVGAKLPVGPNPNPGVNDTNLYVVTTDIQVLNVFGISFDASRFFPTTPTPLDPTASTTNTIIIKSSGQFIPSATPCTSYYYQKSRLYSLLLSHLSPSLAPLVASLESLLFSRAATVVGVHYREFDGLHDWAVVPPQAGLVGSDGVLLNETEFYDDGDDTRSSKSASASASVPLSSSAAAETAGTWSEVSPIELFVADMQSMLLRDPAVRFFVASNSPSAKSYLASSFPADVVYTVDFESSSSPLPDSDADADDSSRLPSSRDSLAGVLFALVDFAVLSKTALVLHSFGSSFGEEAAAVRPSQSVRVRRGGDIYGVDAAFEDCNNNQLLSERANRRQDEGTKLSKCFTDGLGKNLCMPILEKNKCKAMEENWGLSSVYC